MNANPIQICSKCHARVIAQAPASQCPACAAKLIPAADQTPGTVDHRGIILPPRHAVGGIITPR